MTKPRRVLTAGVIALAALVLASWGPARAALRLDITSGQVQPMPIAIPAFAGAAQSQTADQIAGVISADLERSGLFRPLDPRSFIQNAAAIDSTAPNFGDWRQINAQALVTGAVATQADGRLGVQFRLWDVFAEQQLAGFSYTTTRRIGGASPISSPTRSTSGSPARRAISIRASSMSPNPDPCRTASSGWRSWTRTAPTTAT